MIRRVHLLLCCAFALSLVAPTLGCHYQEATTPNGEPPTATFELSFPEPPAVASLNLSCPYASPEVETRLKFGALVFAWQVQSKEISYSSNTGDYLALPAFRSIVQLGPPVVTLLRDRLEADPDTWMLAFAVTEICTWDMAPLYRGIGDNSLREGVLEALAILPGFGARN